MLAIPLNFVKALTLIQVYVVLLLVLAMINFVGLIDSR
jgi:hypothetical protein